jgi:Ribonuclease P/MRP, subunit p29
MAITESITDKTLVLENLTSQLTASTSVARVKRKLRRQATVPATSNKKLRTHDKDMLDPMKMVVSVHELEYLNDMWNGYITKVISECQSPVQLQARLCAVELVGARVAVAESKAVTKLGITGYMIASTASCFYIASLRKSAMKRLSQIKGVPKNTKPSSAAASTSTGSGLDSDSGDDVSDADDMAVRDDDDDTVGMFGSNPNANDTDRVSGRVGDGGNDVRIHKVVKELTNLVVYLPPSKHKKAMGGTPKDAFLIYGKQFRPLAYKPANKTTAPK